MSRTADISFTDEAVEASEQFFMMLIGWSMTVIPEANIDIAPFIGELTGVGVSEGDGQIKGIWKQLDSSGNLLPGEPEVMLDIYDELDRVEVL